MVSGVQSLQNETLRDYLILILLTGLRRQEAAKLMWEHVDLVAKTLTIVRENAKNNELHTLPLSDYLFELLKSRSQNKINQYVFPGTGSAGYIIEPRKQMANVTKASGIHFTVHDLRRSFITIAEGLDISTYAANQQLFIEMYGGNAIS